MAGISDSIVDVREELMFSFSDDGNPILRTAHFLKPSLTFTDTPDLEHISLSPSSLPPTFEPEVWPLKVKFNGWKSRSWIWRQWVYYMSSKHEAVWKEAGIYDAIINSTYGIQKDDKLVLGIAERWSSDTKSFNFPWAEVTITLEDVMVIGGYSVLGDSVLRPLESSKLKEIHEKLIQAHVQAGRTRCRRALHSVWIKMFMCSGSEFEHEAFLVTWLSRFVFANSNLIRKLVFPIAIHLARGTRIALAPAVLASIYRNLSLLKEAIVASTKCNNGDTVLQLNLFSPLQLLRLWALERFQGLQPQPNLIAGKQFFASWQGVPKLRLSNIRLALASAGECFQWRPYTKDGVNWYGSKLFGDKAMWVTVGPTLDEQQESFARCLRVSQLVGLDCIEQYLPHRVAMQFGFDQDLPACVAQSNDSPEVAWANYSKPLCGEQLYIPSIHFEAGVTSRYLEFKKSMDLKDAIRGTIWGSVKRKRSSRSTQGSTKTDNAVQKALNEDKFGCDIPEFPPGFPPKCNSDNKAGKSLEVEPVIVIETISSDDDNLDNGAASDGMNLGQNFSAFSADNRAVRVEKLVTESAEKSTQSRASMEGLRRTMNDVHERNAGNLVHSTVSQEIKKLCLELEEGMDTLERGIAKMREERLARQASRV